MGELDNGKKPTELILMQGEFVVFHSKLVHFGGAYTESNLRMHVYLLSPKCGLGTIQDEDGLVTECVDISERKSNERISNSLIAKAVKAKAVKKQKREQQGKRLLLGKRLRGQQPIEVIV